MLAKRSQGGATQVLPRLPHHHLSHLHNKPTHRQHRVAVGTPIRSCLHNTATRSTHPPSVSHTNSPEQAIYCCFQTAVRVARNVSKQQHRGQPISCHKKQHHQKQHHSAHIGMPSSAMTAGRAYTLSSCANNRHQQRLSAGPRTTHTCAACAQLATAAICAALPHINQQTTTSAVTMSGLVHHSHLLCQVCLVLADAALPYLDRLQETRQQQTHHRPGVKTT